MCITYYRSLHMQYEGKLKLVSTLHIKENFKFDNISFLLPKSDPTKTDFSRHVHRTVFDESGTDRKLTVSPVDPCYSRQNGVL